MRTVASFWLHTKIKCRHIINEIITPYKACANQCEMVGVIGIEPMTSTMST
jgi:hypothetical protein